MSNITLILLAAGNSTRFSTPVKKQWLRIGHLPLWYFVTNTFDKKNLFDKIIITAHSDEVEYMSSFCEHTIIEGEVSDSGYIYGIYYAESVHDKGVGNFFLEFTNDGDLEGLWSGYDSINKKIVSGKYLFKKKPTIIVSKVQEKNLPTILHIADKQLGKDYINANDFIEDDFLKFQASINDKIVGFITSKELTIEEVYKKIPTLKDKKLNQFNVVSKLSYIGSIATDPKYEGLGVASALFEYMLNELNKKDYIILMTGWKSKNGININGIAKKFGFDEILEIKDFWKEDSIENNYDCPVCSNPCLCSAVIYVKHENSTETSFKRMC